eukprot:2740775-Lingulodinium_polyedra.AAC.1
MAAFSGADGRGVLRFAQPPLRSEVAARCLLFFGLKEVFGQPLRQATRVARGRGHPYSFQELLM